MFKLINNLKQKYKQKQFEKRQEKYDNIIKEKTQKQKFKEQIKSIKVNTFTKALVAFITLVALIDLQLSYVLAFMDKIQIAEELSKQVCTTILGVAFVYMVRAYFDSKAEYGTESTKKLTESSTISKISNVLSDAGIYVDVERLLHPDEEPTVLPESENIDDDYSDNTEYNEQDDSNISG